MDVDTLDDLLWVATDRIGALQDKHATEIRACIVSRYGIDDATADRIVADTFQAFAVHPERFSAPVRPRLFSIAASAAVATRKTACAPWDAGR